MFYIIKHAHWIAAIMVGITGIVLKNEYVCGCAVVLVATALINSKINNGK